MSSITTSRPLPKLLHTGNISAIPFTSYIQPGRPRMIWRYAPADFYLLLYVKSGEISVRTSEKTFCLTHAAALILPSGYPFEIISKESHGTNITFTAFTFPHGLPVFLKDALPFYRPSALFLTDTLDKLAYYERRRSSHPDCADALLFVLLHDVIDYRNAVTDTKYLFDAVTNYIARHGEAKLTPLSVSLSLRYPKSLLASAIREFSGKTFSRLIAEEKARVSARYLRLTAYTETEIAKFLGFSSKESFVKFFRYHQGTSPAKYRKP